MRMMASIVMGAFATILAGSANAADLPFKAPPPAPPIFSWTGIYAGLNAGGSIQAIKQGLDRLIELAVVKSHSEGGTMIIPGHGRLCDQADAVVYDQMVTVVSDRIRDMISHGMTLQQVKDAKPTADWDPLYGKTSGPWTTDMFVEAAYKSLSAKGKEAPKK